MSFTQKRKSVFVLLLPFIFLFSHTAKGQRDTLLGIYQAENGAKIEIRATKPLNPCAESGPDWQIFLRPFNLKKLSSKQIFLSFRIPVENCSGYHINRAFSFDLRKIRAEEFDETMCNMDYPFEATRVLKPIFDIQITPQERVLKDSTVTRILPTPASITGIENAVKGEPVVLKITGPVLPTGAYWAWYRSTCANTQPFKTGNTIEFIPEDTTVLYVRSQADQYSSPCTKVLITPKEKPKPYTTKVNSPIPAKPTKPANPTPPKSIKATYRTFGLGLATFDELTFNPPPFWFALEFPTKIQQFLHLGAIAGISTHFYKSTATEPYYVFFPTIGFRSKLVFTEFFPSYKTPNIPFQGYAGISFNVTGKLTNWKEQYSEPNYKTKLGFSTGLHLGANYLLSKQYSIFAEINSSIAPLSIGVLMHPVEKNTSND